MLIYLSGSYSGNVEENTEIARRVAINLWEMGYTVITPHLNTYLFERDCKCNYKDYIRGDLEIISRCDAIIMLPNWPQSKGATREKEFAKYLGLPIFYYPEIPPIQARMTDDQESHLGQVISKIIRAINTKYRIGQREHGGNLFDKPNLSMLLEEVQDMVVYAYTLQEQILKAKKFMEFDPVQSKELQAARNILKFGNAQGVKLSDKPN